MSNPHGTVLLRPTQPLPVALAGPQTTRRLLELPALADCCRRRAVVRARREAVPWAT